jgi:hypothetical protein
VKKSLLWTIIGVVLVVVSIGILQLANYTAAGMIYVFIGSILFFLISLFVFALSIKKVWLKVLIILAELVFVVWIIYGILNPARFGF